MKTVICVDKDKKEYEVPVEKLTFRPSIYGVIIKDGRALLAREWDGYNIPGGAIELGESQEDALTREVREETGLDVKVGKLITCENSFYKWQEEYWHSLLFFFLCEAVGGELSIDGLEEIEKEMTKDLPEWVPLADIDKIKFHSSYDSVKVIKRAAELLK